MGKLNHENWARSMISFIRARDLESEFKDYCGGWPCRVASLDDDPWQPIASAPKDWTDVLVYSPEHEGFNCGGVFSAFYDTNQGAWFTHWASGNMRLDPTYWMPLPDAPAIVDRSPKGGDGEAGSIADESAGAQPIATKSQDKSA